MNTKLSELPLGLDAKATIAVVIIKALREWAHPKEHTTDWALALLAEHGLVDIDDKAGTFMLSNKCVARIFYDILSPYFTFPDDGGNICGGANLWGEDSGSE